MFAMNNIQDIHAFEIRGRKIAFNAKTFDIAVLDEFGYSVLSRSLAGKQLSESETMVNEVICRELMTPTAIASQTSQTTTSLDTPLTSLCLIVVSSCNIRCDYCFNHQGTYGLKSVQTMKPMSQKTAQNSVDFLLSKCGEHCEISFFGGEPLTRFQLIKDTVNYAELKAKSKGIDIAFHITTNGILITSSIAKFLKQHQFSVIISMDGNEEMHNYHRRFTNGHGTYQSVIEGAKTLLTEYGSQDKITIRGTYTNQQMAITDAFIHMVNNGFTNISIEPCTGNENDEYAIKAEDVNTLSKEYANLATTYMHVQDENPQVNFFHLTQTVSNLKDRRMTDVPCSAANGYMAVFPDGGLYPCHRIFDERYKLGNVNEVVGGANLVEEIREAFRKARTSTRPVCQTCWARNICGGGCYASSIEDGQSLLEFDKVECELVRLRAKLAIGLLAEQKLVEFGTTNKSAISQHITAFKSVSEFAESLSSDSYACRLTCENSCQSSCQRMCQGCQSSCTASCTTGCQQHGGCGSGCTVSCTYTSRQ